MWKQKHWLNEFPFVQLYLMVSLKEETLKKQFQYCTDLMQSFAEFFGTFCGFFYTAQKKQKHLQKASAFQRWKVSTWIKKESIFQSSKEDLMRRETEKNESLRTSEEEIGKAESLSFFWILNYLCNCSDKFSLSSIFYLVTFSWELSWISMMQR